METNGIAARRRNLALATYSALVFAVNLASIALARAYLIDPVGSPFWYPVGWVFLTGWAMAITLTLFVPSIADTSTPAGRWLGWVSRVSMAAQGIAPVCMFAASFLHGTVAFNSGAGALAVLYASFFVCTSLNCIFAFLMARRFMASRGTQQGGGAPTTAARRGWKWLAPRIAVAAFAALSLATMAYMAALLLAGSELGVSSLGSAGVTNGLMGVVSGTYGWFFSIFAWHAAARGMMTIRGLGRPRIAMAFGAVGLVVGAILLAPMVATPLLAPDADAGFGEAFGSDWSESLPPAVLAHFRGSQLNTADCFLEPPLGECTVIQDILFFNGTAEGEGDLLLYFDAYLPPAGRELPGGNSTLIRIHGGGWTIGDKGSGNMPLMNRYFASQGYCVFDIQYPLTNRSGFLSFARSVTPAYLVGNYSIDDMISCIGTFCLYLTLHQAEYGADLGSVFVSGGSAGGHLTTAVALAIASGNYSPIFGTGLTVRGYIPFYPALHGSGFIDGGTSEFHEPISLVAADSPPCLVYHGLQDGLVSPQASQDLKDRYEELGNDGCQVIFFPFAGHGSDIAFYGYYNQFFIYYMERFMYLNR